MEIKEIKISLIKPDPNQPRQELDKLAITEMAQSIKAEGVINPIEIDKQNVIITGSLRWRAAKEAGLTKIPCKIMSIEPNERFRRQVIENLHHNDMGSLDTARALKKLILMEPGSIKEGRGGHNDKGIGWLSDQIGKSRTYIREYLDLLDTSKGFQAALKKGLKPTFIRAIRQAPEEHRPAVERKIAEGEFKTRDGAQTFVKAMNLYPDQAPALIELDYSDCETAESTVGKIQTVIPQFSIHPTEEVLQESRIPTETLIHIKESLLQWLDNNDPEDMGIIYAEDIIETLVFTRHSIEQWLDQIRKNKQVSEPN